MNRLEIVIGAMIATILANTLSIIGLIYLVDMLVTS